MWFELEVTSKNIKHHLLLSGSALRIELLRKKLLSTNYVKNTDIVIAKPDKGSGVAILNKYDYIKKMETSWPIR